jgi:hypothetical protein
MKPDPRDPNYPRMMFHRTLDPVTVRSESEELALGAEWSRRCVFPPGEVESAPPAQPLKAKPVAVKAKAQAKPKPKAKAKKRSHHAIPKNPDQHQNPVESGGSV